MTEIIEPEVKQLEDETSQNSLQKLINSLQEELHNKDTALANITKEKERLQYDLKKYKRANNNLKQQLEDERAFYLKEKEYYCKEMSVTKKIRKEELKNVNVEDVLDQIKETENLKKELSKLKSVLNETLEANYNLSIKFLRMKNTKYSLKTRLKREQTENAKIISDLAIKLENTEEEINYIISDKFRMPIPPSNKKYLQIVKQNTQLIHDTLNYQIKISKLHNDIERVKAEKIKNDTNLRLQYARTLKLENKESSDKICEANLDQESTETSLSVTLCKERPSESTISSNNKDFQLYPESEFSVYQIEAIRTHSAPEFRRKDEVKEETDEQFHNT